MNAVKRSVKILIAEDDEDDFLLASKALQEVRLVNEMYRVKDGEELMDYLMSKGNYQNREMYPLPNLILLDLNLPRKDGREALKEIKAHPELQKIPVIVLTTSKSEEDVVKSYGLGVNSFIRKPVTFQGLVDIMKTLKHYWLDIVTLPPQE